MTETLTLKKSRENQFGQKVFDAMADIDSPMTVVRVLQHIAGSVVASTAPSEEDLAIACSMCGSWLREGIEDQAREMAKDVKQGMN